jgi:hypothetical protein
VEKTSCSRSRFSFALHTPITTMNIVPYLVLGLLFGLLVQSLTLWLPG